MPQRTPNPSGADILVSLPLRGIPNMRVVLGELLERLRTDFPVALNTINPDVTPPRTADSYKLAPAVMEGDGFAHTVLVGNDLEFEVVGVGTYFGQSTLQVMIVDEQRNSGYQLLDYWDQVEAMSAVLGYYSRGCANNAGVQVWKSLIPRTVEKLPEQYASGYHGVIITCEMEFQQRSSGWPSSNTGTGF